MTKAKFNAICTELEIKELSSDIGIAKKYKERVLLALIDAKMRVYDAMCYRTTFNFITYSCLAWLCGTIAMIVLCASTVLDWWSFMIWIIGYFAGLLLLGKFVVFKDKTIPTITDLYVHKIYHTTADAEDIKHVMSLEESYEGYLLSDYKSTKSNKQIGDMFVDAVETNILEKGIIIALVSTKTRTSKYEVMLIDVNKHLGEIKNIQC